MENPNRRIPLNRQLVRAAGAALLVAGGAAVLQAAGENPKANKAQEIEAEALDAMERGRHGFDVLPGTVGLAPGVNVRETPVTYNADPSSDETEDNIAFKVDGDGATLQNPLVHTDGDGDVWYGAQRPGSDDINKAVIWINGTGIEDEDPSKFTITVDLDEDPSNQRPPIADAVIEGGQVVSPSYPKGPLAVFEE